MVPLGFLLLEGGTQGVEHTLERIETCVRPFSEVWAQAVDAELRMACEEHCRSVDPRYLKLPNYDFDYTVAARERLEARLVAANALGLEPPEELLDRVARADEVLEPFLQERD